MTYIINNGERWNIPRNENIWNFKNKIVKILNARAKQMNCLANFHEKKSTKLEQP